jgi:saccharopine dehydrogenase (NAD+, L-lysine-forming)
VVTQPWRADVVTVPASVPEVRTYMAFPAPVRALMRLPHGPVLRAVARRLPEGPSAAALARGRSAVWARVTEPGGATATGTVTAPDAYVTTALAAAACLRRVLAGDAPPGVHSPAGAWGPALLADVPELTFTLP